MYISKKKPKPDKTDDGKLRVKKDSRVALMSLVFLIGSIAIRSLFFGWLGFLFFVIDSSLLIMFINKIILNIQMQKKNAYRLIIFVES